ncbi:MAG TPA: iron chelate uptake ABC transporter family permease subunit [Anoxybacillus sp.]|jgi:manganese/zinc/iron transport system permease protein|nr:iron chelate uptake ABC transporter family permease subunit [Anoxybacillus sp.]
MSETLVSIWTDANTQWVLIGTLLLGLASGLIGSFALLKKQSLIGDAMAHAALPGICIAFLIHGAKSMSWFIIGAALSGLLATFFIEKIIKLSRIKEDTSIGLVLSVFFGFGIVLLTYINHQSKGNQSGIDDFIFGQAASLVGADVKLISAVAVLLIIITVLLFKELKLLTFDPQFAQGIGLPTGLLNGLLMTLIVGVVVIGLQAVGVILMSAMLITPAIAARYWTERLDHMVIIAGAIGAFSGVFGTLLSTTTKGMPTGPLIIVAATIIFLISMVFAPKRGLLVKAIHQSRLRKQVAREQVLQTLYDFTEQEYVQYKVGNGFHEQQIMKKRPISISMLQKVLSSLEKEELVRRTGDALWCLTEKGLTEAYHITLRNRLMEVYLMNEMTYAHFNIRQDQSMDLLQLPEKVLTELKQLLKQYGREPLVLPEKMNAGKRSYHRYASIGGK